MKYNDIAVIGVSGRFPKSENIEEFHYNLYNKIDCVGKMPSHRMELLNLKNSDEYMECGYLEDIEYFDNDFFGIPNKEADYMSPEQRIMLELTAETILSAGYSLKSFRGSNCGVFISSSESEYESLLTKKNAPTRLGSLNSVLSGRIAYQFDLRGPNIFYDTGCSSSLVAVHEACSKLMTGEIDFAIVGGISISLKIPRIQADDYDALGLCSRSFRSRSFDKNADGVAIGEGGGCILLKRLEAARADKDFIWAIIKSGAINSDGGRCSSVTMPSVYGQKEVMLLAWKDIDLSNLTSIEAHGIGTSIGDSIEAQSIIENMNELGIKHKIRLGSVKSNIGHLGYSAGISSIIKALLELKYNITYPIVHFKEGNPLIGFEKTSLMPVKDIVHWDSQIKRSIGIDSFGLGGTNAHIVIEKYIQDIEKEDEVLRGKVLKISAKSETSFYAYIEKIHEFISSCDNVNISNLIYTLNIGRDDYQYRRMVKIKSKEDLLEKLELLSPYKKEKEYKVMFCMKMERSQDETKYAKNVGNTSNDNEKLLYDADFKEKMYRFCKDIGIEVDLVLADNQSKAIINYCEGKIDEGLLRKALLQPINEDYSKVIKFLKETSENYLVLNFGNLGLLKNLDVGKNIKIYEIGAIGEFDNFLIAYYNNGKNINWENFYERKKFQKIAVQGYCFDKISHWANMKQIKEENSTDILDESIESHCKEKSADITIGKITNALQEIWKSIFGFTEEIGCQEDFFELGGNSLLVQNMSKQINDTFKIDFDAYEVYENETIEKLAVKIFEFIRQI